MCGNHAAYKLLRRINLRMKKTCAYCGNTFEGDDWPHVEGNSNYGVVKIEHFCSQDHRSLFLTSKN